MEYVKVKAIANHARESGMVLTGQEYETTAQRASELKRNGLVEYDGPAAPAADGEKILVSDKPREKKEITPVIEKVETKDSKSPKKK